MPTIRRSQERGQTLLPWLDSRHTFSFGDYVDPRWAGFRSLRVINDDRVGPGGGFPTHAHHDMEILTYVLEGALAHRDSLGHFAVTRAGELQRMTAGTGIEHSEFNHSQDDAVRFLQVWIKPERKGLAPGYEQRALPRREGFALAASRDGRKGSLLLHQDADVLVAELEEGEEASYELRPARHAWLHVARGDVAFGEERLGEGDGAAVAGAARLRARARTPATILLFDLA
jgi:redox-sensitive bicupin YhaK (pirin superfamily)